MFLTNPFMTHWLSAANATAGTMRGYWMGEMHRQQTAMAAEMSRQAMRFWTTPWMAQLASKAAPAALSAVEGSIEQLRVALPPSSVPHVDAPAPLAAATPRKSAAPPVAQLRSRAERRSTGPKRKAQAPASAARTAGKARSQRTARKAR
ncbi:hypothetical protein [Roseomonas rosulenta]|uniref:hypothetical protein n=1 Tax=Roseomonas rosulenta TaxID=2748667 RepID=UPI0018DF0C45|nr:hypothetical protein [Roseomonas rosulenta]